MTTTRLATKGTVLLVDDDFDDRRILEAAFEREAPGISFHAVPNHAAAMEELHSLEASGNTTHLLMISDLKLVGGTGVDLLKELRSDIRICDIPFLILSNSRSEADVRSAYIAGCNGYFIKPLTLTATREFVRRVVDYWLSSEASVTLRSRRGAFAPTG